ncbi:MAG: xylulokinase [Candidatus Bathyarchaeota archaeon]|nr:xylulokinase [Candidatus Bathyarchaeota archaeon]
MKNYYIGVDSGTQSTKTVIIDGEGTVLGKSTKEYGLIQGLPLGHMEQHPETWAKAMIETMKKAIKVSKVDSKLIKAIGVSGQQHGFVPLDESGNVIRPAKLWNDTSTSEECSIITERLGGADKVVDVIGNSVLPGYTAPKILWLKRHEPENYALLDRVLLPHDYLDYVLTGAASMEYGDASGTALMDIKTRKWSKEAIAAIDQGLIEKLPVLQPSDKPVGFVQEDISVELGLSEGVIVSAGGGDNMMGAIGTGNTSPGKVTVSLGTSGTIYAYSESPVIDPVGEVAAFCDSTNAWLPMVCTMNVTVATELVRGLFKLSYEEMEGLVKDIPPGSDGAILLPYLTGERTPNMPDGKGVLYGLTPQNFTPGHISRSAMEGVTMGLNYGLNRLRELGVEPTEIRLTGGGSRNKTWRQIAADVFNAEIVTLKESEGAAYGAALQSMWCHRASQGDRVTISEITGNLVEVDESSRVKPVAGNVETYRLLQRKQDKLSQASRPLFTP